MYYLLAFKLLRRKSNSQNLSLHRTRFDTDFVGFSDFLKNLPDDKKIAVGPSIKGDLYHAFV